MFVVQKDGLRIQVLMQGDLCGITLAGRLVSGAEPDEACAVTAFDGLLGDLLKAGARQFDINIAGLTEIDIHGASILRRLQERAQCRLGIPQLGTRVQPLLAIELLTKFDWRTVDAAA